MTDGGWDFEVVRVSLDGLSINAGQRLGMVIVQPEYELIPSGTIPFRVSDEFRAVQNALIEKAFQIRAAENRERGLPIPFVLFPEAAIPVRNPDGLDCLRQQMEQAQGDIIFIGGLEGVSVEEAREIATRLTSNADATLTFTAGAFVNVCVIVVKLANGQLSWHFQAKLRPSLLEQPRNMSHGQRVLYFVTPQVAFLCQICFDHIAAEGEEGLNTVLCQKLIESTQPVAPLDFVFVPQYNPKPGILSVRQSTSRLLNYQDRGFKNDMMAVVVINKAAEIQEPSEYGRSSIHYRAGRWPIPTSDIGPKGYELCESDGVTSAVFRKRTQAIHVATLVPPSYNVGNSTNPRGPLENPRSYLIREGCDTTPCSCLSGTTSEVGRFVECDCLPCKLRDALLADLPASDARNRWESSEDAQRKNLTEHYREIRGDMLTLGCERASELLDLLFHKYEGRKANPDTWIEPRPSAVQELAAALCVLREWHQPLDLDTKKLWTALLGDFLAVVVLDGEDRKHDWITLECAYRKAFEDQYFRLELRERVVLFVALRSQGEVESGMKSSWIYWPEPRDRERLGDGQSITKPKRLRFCICQGSLLEQARLEMSIKDFMESKMRCING
ncbi:MAG: hypothetical protein CEE38_13705 [Planctomycetes bacterium B3_Pla]|nr:MAG: hypothetical protein CEE38_13705 [Planctomycetes bacterium B3_Pla]